MKKELLPFIVYVLLLALPITGFGQAPNLGTASTFALFTANGAFNTTGAAVVTGDVGTSVGAFNAFPPGSVTGQIRLPGSTQATQAATDVVAAYLNWNKQWGKWGIQAGLRYEHTSYNGLQHGSPDQAKHKDSAFAREYGSLFPTLFASYASDKKNTFTFSYGRRIDRPSYQDLNPFLFFIDKYTYEQGNPYMRPQFTHNFELGHSFKGFLNTSVNYSITRDMMAETFEQATVANGGNGYA
ncbi:MAG: TonB-dependent receptor, partial [Cytophagaceae bacterium]